MFKNKSWQRLLAVFALVGFIGTTSLVNVSEAATPKRNTVHRPAQTQSIKRTTYYNKRPVVVHRPAPKPTRVVYHKPAPHRHERESHSDTGNLVTGLIIGGVLGAIIANNA